MNAVEFTYISNNPGVIDLKGVVGESGSEKRHFKKDVNLTLQKYFANNIDPVDQRFYPTKKRLFLSDNIK